MATCAWVSPEPTIPRHYCDLPAHEGHDFCIFHIPLEEKRSDIQLANQFFSEFRKKFLVDSTHNERQTVPGDQYPILFKFNEAEHCLRGFEFPDKCPLNRISFRSESEREDDNHNDTEDLIPISFRWAKFGKNISFRGSSFGKATDFRNTVFGDAVSFWRSQFDEGLDLRSSSFGNNASFQDVRFLGNATFSGATFGRHTSFANTVFIGNANFTGARFDKGVCFYFSVFKSAATFETAEFNSDFRFIHPDFMDKTSFDNALFIGETIFLESLFKGPVSFCHCRGFGMGYSLAIDPTKKEGRNNQVDALEYGALHLRFEKASFQSEALFRNTNLTNSTFQQVDLSNLSFLYGDISETRFISCDWGEGLENPRLPFRNYWALFHFKRQRLLFDELLWRRAKNQRRKSNNLFTKIASFLSNFLTEHVEHQSPEESAEILPDLRSSDILVQALQLKQSLIASNEPIAAGDFHFAVMEMKREEAVEKRRWGRAGALWLYRAINGYGERYGRTLLWLILLVVGFSFFYQSSDGFDFTKNHGLKLNYWDYLLYATQHVLPFKFNQPVLEASKRLAQWLSFIETFVGTSLFTLFLLALRNRFKR